MTQRLEVTAAEGLRSIMLEYPNTGKADCQKGECMVIAIKNNDAFNNGLIPEAKTSFQILNCENGTTLTLCQR